MNQQPFVINTNTAPWEFLPIPFLNDELPVKTVWHAQIQA